MSEQRGSRSILEVAELRKTFQFGSLLPWRRPVEVVAVDNVSFRLSRGECLGIVGESGCGKSTLARTILRLLEPDGGRVIFDGMDITSATTQELKQFRRRMQIVFQDPYSSLNPRRTVRQTLEEPLLYYRLGNRREAEERAKATIVEVGLPLSALDRYPHEFSGGQRQRIGIARALILDPDLVIADEPVSALDVSVQAQILQLLNKLRESRNLSFLFISHDLGVVRHFCERVAVMYLGRIVEDGATSSVLDQPSHPYSRLLRDSSPVPDPRRRITLSRLDDDLPSPANPPNGCHFHPRCSLADVECRHNAPELRPVRLGRFAACHHPTLAGAAATIGN